MENKTATIAQLRARKQHYKLRMFQKLQYILLFVVFVIFIFFVVSTLTFTGRLAEGADGICILYRLSTYDLRHFVQIMRQRVGGPVGGFSTAGYPCSSSSPLGTSPIYGDHQPTTADKSPLSMMVPDSPVLIIYPGYLHC
jgi:hypothetical protein